MFRSAYLKGEQSLPNLPGWVREGSLARGADSDLGSGEKIAENRSGKVKMRLVIVAGLVGLLAPNAVWLGRSTVGIENRTDTSLQSVQVTIGTVRTVELDLPRQADRFLILPTLSEEATLSVRFFVDGGLHEACHEYVEGAMYHVEIRVDSDFEVRCDVDLPLFSRLLLWEWLRNVPGSGGG